MPPDDPEHDALIGTTVDGRFTLLARIGSGGMGTVYRARQLSVDRDVAVKFIHEAGASNADHIRRFEKEARIIARLEDPHTLKLIDFGVERGRRFLVTEYLQGETLGDRLARVGRLDAEAVRALLRPICDALAEAHEQGVIHRDLKPHNLFLQRVGGREVVRVLDFGIARWQGSDLATTTGPMAGSPAYMSPEQARGEEVDGRADLYALGVVAYECLAGRRPFEARTPALMLIKQLQDRPKAFDELDPPVVVPQAMEALVLHLLEKAPEDRPASARILARRLDAWVAEPAPTEVEAPRRPRRWPWVVGLAVVGGVGVWWAQGPETQGDSGAARPDAALPDAARPDAARPDAALPDAARPDAARPDAARPDAAQPDAARPDAARPDAARPIAPATRGPHVRPKAPPTAAPPTAAPPTAAPPTAAPPTAAPPTAAPPAAAPPTAALSEPPPGFRRVVPPP